VYIALLGGVRVRVDAEQTDHFPRRKVAALLAVLALRPRQVHSREEVAGALWPDAPGEEARHSLRQTLSLLRRYLGGAPFVLADAQTLRLSPGCVTDVAEFEAAVRTGDTERARRLWRGELLPGFYDEWAQAERERLEALREAAGLDDAPPVTAPPPSRLPPPDPDAGRLPTYLSSFHGRVSEAERLGRWLRAPEEARLLTLIGPGGIGKTRLAVAATLRDSSAPTWFVDLSALAPGADAAAVAAAAASALDCVPRDAATSPRAAVCALLKERPGRLLLDNCEHLLTGAAVFAADVLAAVPTTIVLATSREPLRVPGEKVVVLDPLPPEDARALFLARARAARESGTDDPEAIRDICRRLDGLPLAIELAAGRVGALTPRAIADRLGDRFRLLGDGAAGPLVPARQRTLRAVLDWSYDLLSPEQRRLFASLAVFAGGWTLAAAEAVCDCPPERLASLVDRSLVTVMPVRDGQEGSSFRYRLLETVREYAAARLHAEEAGETRARHAAFYAGLAQEAAAGLRGPEQGTWLERLEAEHDNLRAACDHLQATDAVAALRAAACLWRFWQMRGYLTEGARRLEQALTAAPFEATQWRAEALLGAADIAYLRGEHGRTEPLYREALALFRSLGDRSGASEALRGLGLAAMLRAEHADARRLLEEAVIEAEAVGDDGALSNTLASLVQAILLGGGDPGDAVAAGERAVRLARAVGDTGRELTGLNLLQWAVSARDGQLAARPLLERALPLACALGARHIEASLLVNLGACAREIGDLEGAESLFQEGAALALAAGDEGVRFAALRNLCEMAAEEGKPDEAVTYLEPLLALAADSTHLLHQALARAAATADALQDAALAIRLFAAAHADHAPDRRWDPALARLRDVLGQEPFMLLWAEGAALSPTDAAALARDRLVRR
jgi:predicted ATPase